MNGEYKLTVFGEDGTIETEKFDFLSEAVEEVEGMCSGDTLGWDFKDGQLKLGDTNHGLDTFVHIIEKK